MNRKIKHISVFILILLLFSIFASTKAYASTTYSDIDGVYDTLAKSIVNLDGSVTIDTDFYLQDQLSYDTMCEKAKEKNVFYGGLINGCSYKTTTSGNHYTTKINFKYYIGKTKANAVMKRAKKISEEVKRYTNAQKIKYVHDYLIDNCNYYIGGDGPYNCLIKGKSNCNGYALSFTAIMQCCNIPVKYLTGDNHAWNAVMLDGNWYNIDVTWDDSGVWDKEGGTLYNYYLKCNSDFSKHAYGSSDAKASYQFDESDTHKFPNYGQQDFFKIVALVVFAIVLIIIGRKIYKRIKQ